MVLFDPNELQRWAFAVNAIRNIAPVERKRVRENAGVTRAVLAELLDCSPRRIEAYEEGAVPSGADASLYWYALEAMRQPEQEPELTAEDRAKLRTYFDAKETCKHCYGIHTRACPRVKKMTYDGNTGALTGIEFWPDGDWPKEHVIFADSPQMREPEAN